MKKKLYLCTILAILMALTLVLQGCQGSEAVAAEDTPVDASTEEAAPVDAEDVATPEPTVQSTENSAEGNTIVISGNTSDTAGQPRTVADREDASDGTSLTPEGYTEDQMPGLPYIGAKPLKKYKVAFSNGDMGNDWRSTFFNDFIACGEYMADEFGIEFIYANTNSDSARQLQDVQSLIAQKPDLLFLSPNESAPLAPVADLCKESGTALITVDRSIDAPIGEDQYILNIEGDNIACGISMGMAIVEGLTEKYGEPRGKVAEIAGGLGSSPAIQRSTGLRMVIERYPDIQIVQVLDGDYDHVKSASAAQDIFTTHPDIDAVANGCDASGIQAVQQAERSWIEDVIFVSVDGDVTFLNYIEEGKAYHTAEYPPYFAITAWEYGIHYLNGVDIPITVLVPEREFIADTPEKAEALSEINAACEELGAAFPPASLGMYDIFEMGSWNKELWNEIYPQNWAIAGGYEYLDSLIPDDPYALTNAD